MSDATRVLSAVLEEVLAVVPDAEAGLRYELRDIQDSSNFAPPDGQRMWWIRAAEELHDAIPKSVDAWHFEVERIFLGHGRAIP